MWEALLQGAKTVASDPKQWANIAKTGIEAYSGWKALDMAKSQKKLLDQNIAIAGDSYKRNTEREDRWRNLSM